MSDLLVRMAGRILLRSQGGVEEGESADNQEPADEKRCPQVAAVRKKLERDEEAE